LKQAGKTVAVLEKSKIANGTTAGTTGKVKFANQARIIINMQGSLTNYILPPKLL
jgi:hypothetical protein